MLQRKWIHSYYSDSASSVYNGGSVFSVVLIAEKEKKKISNMLHNKLDEDQSLCYMLLNDLLKLFYFKCDSDYYVCFWLLR